MNTQNQHRRAQRRESQSRNPGGDEGGGDTENSQHFSLMEIQTGNSNRSAQKNVAQFQGALDPIERARNLSMSPQCAQHLTDAGKPPLTGSEESWSSGYRQTPTGWKRTPQSFLLPPRNIVLDNSREMGGLNLLFTQSYEMFILSIISDASKVKKITSVINAQAFNYRACPVLNFAPDMEINKIWSLLF